MDWGTAISIGGKILGGIMGRNSEQAAIKEWWDRTLWQTQKADRIAHRDKKWNRQNMRLADRLSDKNIARAQKFQSREADKARAATEAANLRNRRWAKEDYRQQRKDMGNQFRDLRMAADKAGLNPLSVLGMGSMVPNPAGGLASSSFAAASGVGFAPVQPAYGSSPMASYGAPLAPALSSAEAIMGGVVELGQSLTSADAVAAANEQFSTEVQKIEAEKARGGLPAPIVPQSTQAMENWGSGLGQRAVPTPPMRGGSPPLSAQSGFGEGWTDAPAIARSRPSPTNPLFDESAEPIMVGSGYIGINDPFLTGGKTRKVLASPDGEILGPAEAANMVAQIKWQEAQDRAAAAESGRVAVEGMDRREYAAENSLRLAREGAMLDRANEPLPNALGGVRFQSGGAVRSFTPSLGLEYNWY